MPEPTVSERILKALKGAERPKSQLIRATGVPYGPLGHALEVLVLEGYVARQGLRYRLTSKGDRRARNI